MDLDYSKLVKVSISIIPNSKNIVPDFLEEVKTTATALASHYLFNIRPNEKSNKQRVSH